MIEAVAATACKATFPLMGSAWTLCLCEGQWTAAAVAVPSLIVLAAFVRGYPGRLRGKRGGPAP